MALQNDAQNGNLKDPKASIWIILLLSQDQAFKDEIVRSRRYC